jgi:hypothetical protein
MGTVGDCYRDSPIESFWESLQIEPLSRQNSKTVVELPSAMAEWIDAYYNPARRHSALGHLIPNEYEAVHSRKAQAASSCQPQGRPIVEPTGYWALSEASDGTRKPPRSL